MNLMNVFCCGICELLVLFIQCTHIDKFSMQLQVNSWKMEVLEITEGRVKLTK